MSCPRTTSTGDFRVTSTGDDRIISADVCSAVVPDCVRVTSFGDNRVTDTGDYRVPSADVCSPVTPPVVPIVGGGGRVMRKGEFPKWWEEWEEPQPKTGPPDKSADEKIEDAVAELGLLEPAKILPFEPKPTQKPAVVERIPQTIERAVFIELNSVNLVAKRIVISEEARSQRRTMAAILLFLLDND